MQCGCAAADCVPAVAGCSLRPVVLGKDAEEEEDKGLTRPLILLTKLETLEHRFQPQPPSPRQPTVTEPSTYGAAGVSLTSAGAPGGLQHHVRADVDVGQVSKFSPSFKPCTGWQIPSYSSI